jgi:hypothetical protein
MFLVCGYYDEEQMGLEKEQEILVCVLNVSSNVFAYDGRQWPAVELYDITNNQTLFCLFNNKNEDRFSLNNIYEVRVNKAKEDYSNLGLYIKRIFE